jgi:hypothetical protein
MRKPFSEWLAAISLAFGCISWLILCVAVATFAGLLPIEMHSDIDHLFTTLPFSILFSIIVGASVATFRRSKMGCLASIMGLIGAFTALVLLYFVVSAVRC